jgi:hypothetical protein
VLLQGLCEAGLGLRCQQGSVPALGVDGGGVVEEQRERKGSGRVWPRATPSSSTPSKNDKGKGFLESLDSRERSPADPFLLLVGLQKK